MSWLGSSWHLRPCQAVAGCPDGEILGVAYDVRDLLEFCRRAGLDPDDIDLYDRALIEWRGESCSRSKQ